MRNVWTLLRRAIVLVPVVIFVATGSAHAQAINGTILGTVADESGGALPGAAVTVTNAGTGISRTTTSGDNGAFLVAALPPGEYRLSVALDGFKSFTQTSIGLEVGESRRVDARLEIGAIAETVTIAASAARVDTTSSSIGTVLDTDRLEKLPMIGRGVLSLAALVPGVSVVSVPQVVVDQRQGPSLSAGGRADQNNVMLDGAQFAAALYNTVANLPSPDSLQQFQVLTNSYSAEYGRASGATVMAITKSGTNTISGSAWEYFRSDKLGEKNFFAPSKPYLRQNQFGGTVGGPLRQNRMFFFGAYEGIRVREQAILRFFPPTAAQRGGDFSALGTPIRDPLTGEPFPGNRIPESRMDPLALNLLREYVPLPNEGTEYRKLVDRPSDGNQVTLKVDAKLWKSDNVDVRFYRNKTSGVSASGNIESLMNTRSNLVQGTTVSNTHFFTPTLLSEARVSFTTLETLGLAAAANKTPRELGASFDQDGNVPMTPTANVQGAFNIAPTLDWLERSRLFNVEYKMSWVSERHAVKFGAAVFRSSQRLQTPYQSSGNFSFNGSYSGNATADFLLGRPVSMVQQAVLDNGESSNTWSGFVQDDFKVSRRVTLNLGLRYDLEEPWEEIGGRAATVIPDQQSTRYPNAPPGLVFPGDAGVPDGLVKTDTNNLSPRVGVAWDVFGSGRTAVRAGYGLFSQVTAGIKTALANEAPPFVQVLAFPPPSFSNPYANQTSPFPYRENPSGDALFSYPTQVFTIDPNLATGQLHQFNVNVQHQVGADLVVQVGYVGSRGRKLSSQREINAAVPGPGATVANAQARRPYYPQYFAGIAKGFADAEADYNSLQISATKRYANGYTVQLAYTLSKAMDMTSQGTNAPGAQDPANPGADWGPSTFDRRHALRVNGMWELPRLDGRRLRHVLGGWRVSGIVSLTSGAPFTVVTMGGSVPLLGPSRGLAAQRPDQVGDPDLGGGRSREARIAQYFNTKAYVVPADGLFGNTRRNSLYGPGAFTTDLSFNKRIGVGHGNDGIELRVEAFNLFNTVNLSNPVSTMSSPAFGQIQGAGAARVMQLAIRYDF